MDVKLNAVPKPKKLPKVKKKKKKNQLKAELFQGWNIPTKQQRGKVSKREYNTALRKNGECCYVCGTTQGLEAHHVKFRSMSGRGTHRNIHFLCLEHHRGNYSPHQNEGLRNELEQLHERLYGPHYYKDVWDLYKEGLIPNTDKEMFEKFMLNQEKGNEN